MGHNKPRRFKSNNSHRASRTHDISRFRMSRMARSCVQSILKMVNSLIGMVGLAMILYAFWMFRVWHRTVDSSDFPPPRFIYTFFGLGAFLCVITCSGHIAAATANGCCLFLKKKSLLIKPARPYVSSSSLPLVLPEKVQCSKVLVECEGESIDLSGDVAAVGRVVISDNQDMLLDLKGFYVDMVAISTNTSLVLCLEAPEGLWI